MAAADVLLDRVIAYAAAEGITDKSLREIAGGVGTSHRMLLYHFGSREGLLAAIVGAVEAQQRDVLASLVRDTGGATPAEVMLRLWRQVSDPALRPYVRLFFATVGLAVQGAPGTQALLDGLTNPWLDEGADAATQLGVDADPVALRLGVAVSRGLLLELLAGADPDTVDASYRLFVDMWQQWADTRSPPAERA
jgi:AcrR family transcriptional regulator